MKNICIVSLLFLYNLSFGQYTLIPDSAFETALISLGHDSGAIDGKVLTANIETVLKLDLDSYGITNLKGIEDFIALEHLECNKNALSSLDLSKNINLKQLSASNNNITNLDLSKNTKLSLLNIGNNPISSLDVSKNILLTKIVTENCPITKLDLANNLDLEYAFLYNNKLTALDVSTNLKLNYLMCADNQIKKLDLSNNKNLLSLICLNNDLVFLNLKNGKSSTMNYFTSLNNPNLQCIQIDDKAVFDLRFNGTKDPASKFSTDCSMPPVIKAVGNQPYCAGSPIKIVTDVSITDSDNTGINEVNIQITSGYVSGQDVLSLSNPTLHPQVKTTWNATTGILKLSATTTGANVLYTDMVAAIKDVEYNTSSANPSGTRNFSINLGLGQLSYLPRNKHFYEYVLSTGISWTNARDAAATRTYYGLQGYLATLTAADEAQLAGEQAPGTGWIGGSDQETEGVWKWVTGPEAGTIFWNGLANGSTPNFAFWNTNNNEPNQFNGNPENYAHITAPGVGIAGSWNDLPNAGGTGSYVARGYIVEYGGMPGDPTLEIAASTSISINMINSTTDNSRCGNGVLLLRATTLTGMPTWYENPTGGLPLHAGTTYTTANLTTTTTFYVDAGCSNVARTAVVATINPLPLVSDIEIFQCDTDIIPDGKSLFNLRVKNDKISSNFASETFSYYTSQSAAENQTVANLITNDTAFENSTPTQMDIWVRVANNITNCSSVSKITLKVSATNIPATYKIPNSPVCDDFLDANGDNNANNNDRDGITRFDLSASKATIQALLPTTETYEITYYRNESDALSEINKITDITNYRNIGYANSQDIWIRVDSSIENACFGLGPYLTINVEALPTANPVTIARQCDDTTNDGIFNFDTSTLETSLLQGQTNVTATYFDDENNPLKDSNGVLVASPFPAQFLSVSQVITAIVTNTTAQQCSDKITIEFIVDKQPTATAIPPAETTACDDEANPMEQDGVFPFDTTNFESQLLGTQTGMRVLYFDENNVTLASPLPNPFNTKSQTITAVIENPFNTNCSASQAITFVVHPLPLMDINVDGSSDELICSNIPNFSVTLHAGQTEDSATTASYTYEWFKDDVSLNLPTEEITVTNIGNYAVQVTTTNGCDRTRNIKVTTSNVAQINSVEVVDLAEVNTITVNASGPGNYQYSLDDSSGVYQNSNIFTNVSAGNHVVYVKDMGGCGIVSEAVTVTGLPTFFTPNNDSFNDVWQIKGLSKYPTASVSIFDRFGRLLIVLNKNNQSWDGTINGQQLPATDYWYVAQLETDKKPIKGHFSLKR